MSLGYEKLRVFDKIILPIEITQEQRLSKLHGFTNNLAYQFLKSVNIYVSTNPEITNETGGFSVLARGLFVSIGKCDYLQAIKILNLLEKLENIPMKEFSDFKHIMNQNLPRLNDIEIDRPGIILKFQRVKKTEIHWDGRYTQINSEICNLRTLGIVACLKDKMFNLYEGGSSVKIKGGILIHLQKIIQFKNEVDGKTLGKETVGEIGKSVYLYLYQVYLLSDFLKNNCQFVVNNYGENKYKSLLCSVNELFPPCFTRYMEKKDILLDNISACWYILSCEV